MMRMLSRFLLLLLLVLPSTLLFTTNNGALAAKDQREARDNLEDILDGEEIEEEEEEDEEDGQVETEEDVEEEEGTAVEAGEGEEEEDEEEEPPLKASPDADTTFLFTTNSEKEIPVTIPLQVLVGFTNNGQLDFTIDSLHASLRYPQDFSFYMYNFTEKEYNTVVEPNKEATFEYSFQAGEVFAARQFGFVVELAYKDSEGNLFSDAVFNDTVSLIELDEGLDTETFFLYVFLAALIVLAFVVIQQIMASFGKKKKPSKQVVETGTSNHTDVDYDWIPKENIAVTKKTPSPRRSPRRRTKRSTGSGDE
ncbi:translocon-associated protein subunit alpha-like [Lytechinus variegatus]|uniref:translocon-associated protein subunit alpha-like n=1 Tax=Lytechinus variegatus TaxID=7654 RepID=UPI001BB18180|nr:translocon-associated protein subunit alpha-like [Lytechinus variegatus]